MSEPGHMYTDYDILESIKVKSIILNQRSWNPLKWPNVELSSCIIYHMNKIFYIGLTYL